MGEIYTKSIKGDIIAMKATEGRIRSQSEHTIDGRRYDLELQVRMGLCRFFSRRQFRRVEMSVWGWGYFLKKVMLNQVNLC